MSTAGKALVCVMISFRVCAVSAEPISTYLPELVGNYTVGDYPEPYGGNATIREKLVNFKFEGWPPPRYFNYEISGILGSPKPSEKRPGSQVENINFNGWITKEDGPGMGWGMTLNHSQWEAYDGLYNIRQSYDMRTGEFYFGVSVDTSYYRYFWGAKNGDFVLNVGAVFYNYYDTETGTFFTDRGFVFIESARAGVSDDPLRFDPESMTKLQVYPDPYHGIPEPSSALLLSIGVAGVLVAQRKVMRHKTVSA